MYSILQSVRNREVQVQETEKYILKFNNLYSMVSPLYALFVWTATSSERSVGRHRFADGRVFAGRFVEGQLDFGTLKTPLAQGGGHYSGAFDRDANRVGNGEMVWAAVGGIPGARFRGEWRGGKPHGVGVMELGLGDVYAGEFKSGAIVGLGQLLYGSGERYAGEVKGGLPHGFGVHTWAHSTARYEGAFNRGRRSGIGAFVDVNGTVAMGEFVGGLLNGRGLLTRVSAEPNRTVRVWSSHWEDGHSRAKGTAPGGEFTGSAALPESALEREGLRIAVEATRSQARRAATASSALQDDVIRVARTAAEVAEMARLEAARGEVSEAEAKAEGEAKRTCVGASTTPCP